jgi:hypothetical protein
MANAEQAQANRGQGTAPTVRTAAAIIYATLTLLIVTIPQSLPNWLRDMEDNPAQQVLLTAASGVQTAAQAVGLDVPYRRARAAFRAWAGKEED